MKKSLKTVLTQEGIRLHRRKNPGMYDPEYLSSLFEQQKKYYVAIAFFIQNACLEMGIPKNAFGQKIKNTRQICDLRACLAYHLKTDMELSLDATGIMLNRNHATIHQSIKKYKNLCAVNKDFKKMADRVRVMYNEFEKENNQNNPK